MRKFFDVLGERLAGSLCVRRIPKYRGVALCMVEDVIAGPFGLQLAMRTAPRRLVGSLSYLSAGPG